MSFYFQLQLKRVSRTFREAGINPILGGFVAVILLVAVSHLIIQREEYGVYLYLLLAIFCINLLGEPSRNEFLKSFSTDSDYKKLRVIENVILSAPFILNLLLRQFYLLSGIVCISSLALSFLTSSFRFNFVLPTPFSRKPFEFIAGFRKTVFICLICYAASCTAIYVHNFNLGIASLAALFLTILSFYSDQEHPFFVWIHSTSASKFIASKLITAILCSTLLTIFVAIPLVVFFPDQLYVILLLEITGIILVIASLLGKYAFYPAESGLIHGLVISFCLVFPYLLIFTLPLLFRKSKKNLDRILA